METLTNDTLSLWLINYGSIAIFFLLALGILALPIPEETLMVIAGVIMYKGLLIIPATILAAYGGAICGISMSYLMGRTAGNYLMGKGAKWLGITDEKFQKVHNWFERFGTWTLLIGYFIPGVRHFTGFFAGLSKLEFRHFALFAYTGAILWVTTFLSIGYFFGDVFLAGLEEIELNIDDILTVAIILAICFLVYFIHKKTIKSK